MKAQKAGAYPWFPGTSIIPTFYLSLHQNQSLKNIPHLCGSIAVKWQKIYKEFEV